MAVVTVNFSELDSWLQAQPDNTANTPYELDIRGLVASNLGRSTTSGTLGFIIKSNNSKYIDLSNTDLPDGVTDMRQCFNSCRLLVTAPNIPNGVTNMEGCFYSCTSLVTVLNIPNGVTNMDTCFKNCTSLVTVPNIPDGVTNMHFCFSGCSSLVTAPNIPNSVTNMEQCFRDCKSLVTAPNIPNGVTNMEYCFSNCTSLVTAPNIPNGVTNMKHCFWCCSLLVTAPNIPDGVTNMEYCFTSCKSLVTAPNIPNGVTNMEGCFDSCRLLVTAPNIPDSVTNMHFCFSECRSLTTVPNIPKNVTNMNTCFFGCTSLVTVPNIPNSVTVMSMCFEDCTSLVTVPNIPNNVIGMVQCFRDCTSLVTVPNIPNSVTNMERCFERCTSLVTVPNIPNSVTNMKYCFNGCRALREISIFEADINYLIENDKAVDAFANTSLTKIGIPSEVSESNGWHCLRLNFDSNSIQGKVYDKTGASVSIPQTQITKETLTLPIKTDELWFPSGYTDQEIDAIIAKVIQYGYTYFNKEVLSPDKKNFILWADDPDNAYSNLNIEVEAADKLTNARNLKVNLGTTDAQSFDGSANAESIGVSGTLPYARGGTGQTSQIASAANFGAVAYCSTAADTVAKTATCYGYKLVTGQAFKLYISNTNSKANPTLNIASTGAKSIFVNGVAATSSNVTSGWWLAIYDGTYYQLFSADIIPSIGCAVCLTGASDAGKIATMPGYTLVSGGVFLLYIKTANTASNPTLNINGTGAKPIYVNNAVATTSNLTAGIYLVRYNGTNYYIDKEYAVMSARSAGSATTANNTYSINKAVTCSTAAGTAAKTVSLSGFTLVKGAKLIINLQNANTAQSALTLNVNSTGAKTIVWDGNVTSSTNYAMPTGYYNCYYDGTYWFMESFYEAHNARVSRRADNADSSVYATTSLKTTVRVTKTCSTAASTVAKIVSVGSYTLSTRDEVLIYFSNANTASNPTLNVNSTGAKPIKVFGTSPNNTNKLLKVGTYYCQYDGTNWNCYPYGVTNEISADNMQTVTSDAVAKALNWQLFTYEEAQTYFGFQMASGYSGNVGVDVCVKNGNLLLLSVFINNISGTGIGSQSTYVIGTCNIRPKNNSDANYGAIAVAIDYKQTATQTRLGIFKDGRVAVMESKGVSSGNNAIRGFFVIPI